MQAVYNALNYLNETEASKEIRRDAMLKHVLEADEQHPRSTKLTQKYGHKKTNRPAGSGRSKSGRLLLRGKVQ